jgi:hypothetical protein
MTPYQAYHESRIFSSGVFSLRIAIKTKNAMLAKLRICPALAPDIMLPRPAVVITQETHVFCN